MAPHTTAMQSTSISNGPGNGATHKKTRAGDSTEKDRAQISLNVPKWAASVQ